MTLGSTEGGGGKAVLRELVQARHEFLAALADVDPKLATTPGLVGEWSARELVAHMGYWCGHAAEALHLAGQGRAAEFGEDNFDVDERNRTVARIAAETDFGTVRQREEGSYAALVDALERAEPASLGERVSYGSTVEEVVREDGPAHYREHTEHLRAWWSGDREADDEADPDDADDPDDPDDELDDELDPGTDDDDEER